MNLYVFVAIFVLHITKGVDSACDCYQQHNYLGKSAAISNAYDSNTFQSCAKTCSFKAYSGNNTYIWTKLTLQWGATTNSNGLIEIFDGPQENGTPLITIKEGERVLDGSPKSQIRSTSSTILIKSSQVGDNPDVFYGSIKAVPKI